MNEGIATCWPASPGAGPVADWERFAVFRESFLALLHPECAAAFRRVGETLYDWALEGQFSFGKQAEVGLGRDLRAAALELRFVEALLADVGRSSALSDLTEVEEEQAVAAARIGRRVGVCAARLEGVAELARLRRNGPRGAEE